MYSKFRAIQECKGKKIYKVVNTSQDLTCLLRDESNERILDILINKRLYASKFEELNDIKEGLFYFVYTIGSNVDNILERIRNAKNEYRICSFSKTPIKSKYNIEKDLRQHLMWAHYAGNHNGIRIDFDIDNSKEQSNVFKVKYTDKEEDYEFIKNINNIFYGSNEQFEFVKKIFTTKQKIWEYEKESRVITNDRKVYIKIKQIVIGRGFLRTTFDYMRNGDRFEDNLIEFARELKELVSEPDVKIFAYKSKYSNELVQVKDI